MSKIPQQQGFTLIELLVVISIIAIISGVGLMSLGAVQRSGRDAHRESDLRNIQSALQQYYADNNFYPPSGSNSLNSLTSGKVYLKTIPVDPSGGSYGYIASSSSSSNTTCTNTDTNPANRCHYYALCTKMESKSNALGLCSSSNYNFEINPNN